MGVLESLFRTLSIKGDPLHTSGPRKPLCFLPEGLTIDVHGAVLGVSRAACL